MSPTDELVPILKKLRMSGLLDTLELRMQQAVEDDLAPVEFLLRILSDEAERRDAKLLNQRVKRANFEQARTLEDVDFLFNPSIPKAKVIDLATCTFIHQRQNVLLLGPSGVGKSHIAQAIGHRACMAGHRVLYTTASDMFRELRAARGDGTYEKRLCKLSTVDVLIIDDLGLTPLKDDEPIDLYDLIRLRYEKASTIITSNRALEELPEVFSDQLLASAAMDRLLDEAHLIIVEGDSYRNPPAPKRPPKRKTTSRKEAKV